MRALLLDFTKCIGCGACVEACRTQNQVTAPPELTVLEKVSAGGVNDSRQRGGRSEERRVGKECHVVCRSRWSPYH